MPKQLMYVSHETHEVMTGREARKRYRKRYTADPKLKYFDVSYYAQDDVSTETIQGIACQRKGKVYTFTVPGWDECSIYGLRDTKRVIHGRLDPAVRNTLGID